MKRALLVGFLVAACAISVTYYAFVGINEYNTNRIASKYYDQKQYAELYDFYFDPQPALTQRAYMGAEDAGITVAVVIDPLSPTRNEFMDEIVAHVVNTTVVPGNAKLYFKYYVTEEEYEEKRGRFIYAAAGHCYSGPDSFAFNRELLATPETDVPALLEKHGLSADLACNDDFVYEDMMESHLFRIVSPSVHLSISGTDATVLVNPSLERLDREIKFKQIGLGI